MYDAATLSVANENRNITTSESFSICVVPNLGSRDNALAALNVPGCTR
jgi:hypothetical protein